MDLALLTVIGIVAVALLFDYTNGFHDSANSISIVVATRVLRPRLAVLWAFDRAIAVGLAYAKRHPDTWSWSPPTTATPARSSSPGRPPTTARG